MILSTWGGVDLLQEIRRLFSAGIAKTIIGVTPELEFENGINESKKSKLRWGKLDGFGILMKAAGNEPADPPKSDCITR